MSEEVGANFVQVVGKTLFFALKKLVIVVSYLLQRADSNGDGILSVEEYQKILQEHNIRYSCIISGTGA